MAQPSSDRLASADAAEALNFLILETGEKTANPNMLNSQDVVPIDESVALGSVGCHQSGYVANAYSSKAPSVYIGSYDNTDGKLGTYVPFVNNEALDNGSHGIHNKPSSVASHGYEYSPQMVHKSCVPVTTQFFARDHGHLYKARQISTPDPFCIQQSISPNSSYSISPTPVSQEKLPVNIDLQGNSKRSGLGANYSSPLRSSGRGGNCFGNSCGLGLLHQGFEGSEVGGLFSDWSNPFDGNNYLFQLSSTHASLKSLGSLELWQDNFGLPSQQKGSLYGFGSCSGSSYTSYSHQRRDPTSDYGSVSTSTIEMDGQSWPTLNEVRHGRRCNDFSCSCTVTPDMLSERNRGPRAFKPKIRTMVNGFAVDNSKSGLIDDIRRESYNRLDFVTNYKDAKFFIIKSYSEDNVHKSIKYGVWASTPNGNKKLDSAYCEAKEKQGTCPIFLFFSVNASAQFCGVAEMVGPVDFHKNVDYWLQDKWSGRFPVKWHIIKDVPNSQFRHILLENNDNKPVTNSRDTQEVEMEHGIEMLNIFKNYETHSSILDDFYFYEQRQKAMQGRKAGQQAAQVAPQAVVSDELPLSLSTDSIKKMSKSFAEAVSLTKHEKEHSAVGMVIPSTTASVAYGS